MHSSYNLVSKIIHWTTALLILGLLSLGFYMAGLDFSENKLQLYALHKSFGFLVLILAFVRVAWHILVKKPKSLPTHKKWEKSLSHAAHILLYVALFAMPLTGWVMSSAGDFTIQFFGIDVPDIVGKDKALFDITRNMHEIIAIMVLGVIGLHMAGAFKHHFIDRDETLARMTHKGLGFGGGAVLVVLAGALFMPPAYFIASDVLSGGVSVSDNVADTVAIEVVPVVAVEMIASSAPQWVISPEHSKISFTASQYGQEFSGVFGGFDGQIYFDENALVQSAANISIDIAPISTGSDDRDGQAVSQDWFDAKNFPKAEFKTTSFEKTEAGTYIAHADLTIRGVTVAVDLPFALNIKEEGANTIAFMTGDLILNRLDFGIGQGEWKSTQTIGNEVKVSVEVQAVKQ